MLFLVVRPGVLGAFRLALGVEAIDWVVGKLRERLPFCAALTLLLGGIVALQYGDELLSFYHNLTNVSSLCLDKTTQATVSCRDFRRTIARFCCTAEHPTCLHFQAAVAAIRLVMNKAITSNLSTMHALMVHRIPKFQTYQNQRL